MSDSQEVRDRLYARFPEGRWKEVSIGEGWIPLVDKLDQDIAAIFPTYELHQVKEKFGGLRFYIGGVPADVYDEIRSLVTHAESKSYGICEDCGAGAEKVSTRGWIRTLCEQHLAEHQQRREQLN